MSYSCTDFTDTILDALGIDVPEISCESPSDQADACLVVIARLQRIESLVETLLANAPDTKAANDARNDLRLAMQPPVYEWPEEESDDDSPRSMSQPYDN